MTFPRLETVAKLFVDGIVLVRLALVVGTLGIIGCSDSPSTYAVAGKIEFDDGTPFGAGFVIFNPDHGPAPRATVGEDGTFALSTFEPGDGAPTGKYRIAIAPDRPADFDPDRAQQPPAMIKPQYFRPETSGLTFEVKAGATNFCRIVVERESR
jgi:hypothetical protein